MATSAFKTLVDTTFDSVEGYRKASESASSPAMKQALSKRLTERQETLNTLNSELQRQGEELVTEGTVSGELHQAWMKVTDMFQNGDENAAERVEEGEDYLRGKFESALNDDDLQMEERQVVQQAYAEISEGERFGDMVENQMD
ncbi:PA2169 family four-helix-bundle protein [Paraurantiacibacter namhicola]|uniref:DUF2383 domain-containing protein n=1 Tax=Paraurantiacibacter namhicola TaxID=645517 RepID=A0A1C7DA32_9SPHN|nr:PA2169 family four-helix-bundle protein [Paraurantiacibacter namhicola]ANU08232.1 hypothetical protein A6F65_01940 [Paraurantiacibacter namhicola]